MISSISVLLVEDDERLAKFTADYLSERGLVVVHVADGIAALREVRLHHFDVVVLDVMLPGKDGLSVCKSIRQHSDVPVLLVTALGEETDRVLGFELGADDYVVKPFSPRELVARLQAFVRRHRGDLAPKAAALKVGSLVIDAGSFTVTLDGDSLTLSPTEFQLLVQFATRPGRVLTREQLLELMKGSSDEAFDRAIDVQVSRLRQKLGEGRRGHTLIKTIRGVGYMLVVPQK
jgi:two-component system, OmpR family, response regulator